MVVSGWLVDKSALSRLGSSSDRDSWSNRIERGLVRISTVTLLEVGFSARSADDWDSAIRQAPVDRMPLEYLSPLIEQRAPAVQRELAKRGQHRGPGGADLLIAATAEVVGLTVLHGSRPGKPPTTSVRWVACRLNRRREAHAQEHDLSLVR